MIKYKAYDGWMTQEIDAVECERETAKYVFIKGSRCAKQADRECFFDSFADAKCWLVSRAEKRVESAEQSLRNAQNRLNTACELKEPQA